MQDNEALDIISDKEEWYEHIHICSKCGANFMTDEPLYCPSCGALFIGTKSGNVTVYNCNDKVNNDESGS